MERVMVTLPSELLEAVDALARQRGRKRSQVVRQALGELLEHQRQREFEALLAEGYQAIAEDTATLVAESLRAQAAGAARIWRWDD